MDIPDEAYQAARTALWGRPAGDATLVAQIAVEAAAPHIVKAAQVQILRETADELDWRARQAGGPVRSFTGYEPAAFLRRKADELEQGAP